VIHLGDLPVALRKFEDRDVESLYRFRNDREITRHLGGFSTGYSRADLAEWIAFHRKRSDEVIYAIATQPSDECIGHVGLYNIDHRIRKAEFAILIGDPGAQGKGLGRAISCWMVDFGFREHNLHKIELTVLADNQRAIRLYERLGFRVDGILRDDQFRDGRYVDVVAMSILDEEWRSTREEA
jgi:RimJ/RimL family protein N-acetyltransferase